MKVSFLFFSFLIFSLSIQSQNESSLVVGEDPGAWIRDSHREKYGKPVIDFSVVDTEGGEHTPALYDGKILVLYFWDIWSWDSCERETADLNRIVEKYTRDVAVISFVSETIYLDERAFLQTHPVKFPVVPESFEFGRTFHGYKTGIPIFFIIDRTGIVLVAGRDTGIIEEMVGK